MFKFMRSKVEKERATKAEEKKRVELLGWEERRQYYREIPGQTFEISKFNFDGKGNTKVLTFDMEDEPTRDMITTRFLDTYGGGVYIVYCHLPFGRMKFATYTLEGEPILPDAKDKKPKDPIDAAIASAISKIPDSELSKIGPAILQNKLGLPTQSTTPPGYLNDPVMNEKLSIARELRSEKRYAEAAQVLTGSIPKNEGELANALKVMDLLDKRYDTRGGHMSEKAQEYDAIGNLIDKAGNAGEKIIGKIMKGKTRDEEDTGNLGYECQCERCGKVVPEDSRSCPHCGLEFVETTPPSPPRNPVEPPPMIEPPKPPEPLGSIPKIGRAHV